MIETQDDNYDDIQKKMFHFLIKDCELTLLTEEALQERYGIDWGSVVLCGRPPAEIIKLLGSVIQIISLDVDRQGTWFFQIAGMGWWLAQDMIDVSKIEYYELKPEIQSGKIIDAYAVFSNMDLPGVLANIPKRKEILKHNGWYVPASWYIQKNNIIKGD